MQRRVWVRVCMHTLSSGRCLDWNFRGEIAAASSVFDWPLRIERRLDSALRASGNFRWGFGDRNSDCNAAESNFYF